MADRAEYYAVSVKVVIAITGGQTQRLECAAIMRKTATYFVPLVMQSIAGAHSPVGH